MILSIHNQWMEEYRNVPIGGISYETMMYQIPTHDGSSDMVSLFQELMEYSAFKSVYPSPRLFDLGKWNLGTTKDDYKDAITFVDELMTDMINEVPAAIRKKSNFEDIPTPMHMGHKKLTRGQPKSTPEYVDIQDVTLQDGRFFSQYEYNRD